MTADVRVRLVDANPVTIGSVSNCSVEFGGEPLGALDVNLEVTVGFRPDSERSGVQWGRQLAEHPAVTAVDGRVRGWRVRGTRPEPPVVSP